MDAESVAPQERACSEALPALFAGKGFLMPRLVVLQPLQVWKHLTTGGTVVFRGAVVLPLVGLKKTSYH